MVHLSNICGEPSDQRHLVACDRPTNPLSSLVCLFVSELSFFAMIVKAYLNIRLFWSSAFL